MSSKKERKLKRDKLKISRNNRVLIKRKKLNYNAVNFNRNYRQEEALVVNFLNLTGN